MIELTPNSSLEVRTIFRQQGRVLEDTQVNAVEQIQNFYYGTGYGYPYDPFGGVKGVNSGKSSQFPATVFGPYVLANPGTSTIPKGLQAGLNFPAPKRQYKALELVYTRRFSNSWQLYANYRLARLDGNYEGLFRNDNGQSDPNITSLYDFPNSPLMSGQFRSGVLPTDTTHVVHVYPTYQFGNKLRIGGNLSWASGVPRPCGPWGRARAPVPSGERGPPSRHRPPEPHSFPGSGPTRRWPRAPTGCPRSTT